ncbi:hypothetical protein A3D09_01550 [Candidatus Collierbacteria bacterium RIFCSPHIGHO2_02_FULL_49_10]|uniref:Gfo/Idh/MocA-like oxidoreductase N-terminal domain-containing protein n=1 Tax=Candidatus Collierbacteria bacterium RIFCSPHIGHO2_02_FULL_49_10 TaxID=1817723 RepID=A0A1F5EWR3_9BACT|nr:MAG: hypothetical protein A3D09_01550 [Candidatus Collierbacteria bacterium RIFCSPHIGHO2_02_FULL_49_10]
MKTKNLKILIVGLGSIGRRHHKNLLALGFRDVWVYDADQKKIKNYELRIKYLGLPNLRKFDIVFVCTPNHLHIKHAISAARAGCDLFIEKPLSHTLKGINELARIVRQKRLVNMVACNMRFHPVMQFIRKYLQSKKLGQIYSIYHEFGYDLASWSTTGRDYRKTYSASKKMGGGIRLDDIHEFDLLFWLNNFTPVKKSSILFDKVSDLQIDTEDIAVGSFLFKNRVFGLVKADYLQRDYTRRCQVVGSRGTLEWDWNENTVWLRDKNGKRALRKFGKYDKNLMYLDEVKYFMDCVREGRRTSNDIARAKLLLTHVIASGAKQSH